MNKKISAASVSAIAICLGLVMFYEGDVPVGYKDPIGIPTAGVGHTGPDVIIGKWYDKATREGWLKEDLSEAASIVEECAPSSIDEYQRAAFISFALNVGKGKKNVKDGFCILKNGNTPTHIKKAREGDKEGSCRALKSWITAGGKKLNGLIRRREAEYNLCMGNESF